MFTYKDLEGTTCQCAIPDEAIAMGVEYKEVPSYEGKEFRDALTSFDAEGAPVFDMEKAKEMVHVKRRAKRNKAFSPYDIEATIPTKAVAAEAVRQGMRDDDAIVQQAIDDCVSTLDLLTVMEGEGL